MQTRTYSIACSLISLAVRGASQDYRPRIPKAWDDNEVERFELPLAQRDRSPRYISSEQYYKLPVRPIYRSYPARFARVTAHQEVGPSAARYF